MSEVRAWLRLNLRSFASMSILFMVICYLMFWRHFHTANNIQCHTSRRCSPNPPRHYDLSAKSIRKRLSNHHVVALTAFPQFVHLVYGTERRTCPRKVPPAPNYLFPTVRFSFLSFLFHFQIAFIHCVFRPHLMLSFATEAFLDRRLRRVCVLPNLTELTKKT